MNPITPISNTELFGYEAIEASLLQDASQGRLPHGIIISGVQGIGKATLAYRFARMLLSGSSSMQLDEGHPIFRRMLAQSHPDFLVVEPEFDEKKGEASNEIGADQARSITEFLSLTPGESAWRVVIIDTVDQLTAHGANAILKILEEPPPQAILLLISHNPGKLLPTIRSRCHVLKCPQPNLENYRRVMRHIAPDLDNEERDIVGALTDYSPGLASQYAKQGASELYAQLISLLETAPACDPMQVHALAEQIGGQKTHSQWHILTRLLLFIFGNLAKQASAIPITTASSEERALFQRLAPLYPATSWANKWHQILEQFLLAQRLHLDYKQVIISFFHHIFTPEGFQIGNATN
ncbi:MAG: DNA polymerase III subunit delta' [Rickettsiales bacterium]|nr:DNA polymerase III subunit delta' [Rickettsiales bacterium]